MPPLLERNSGGKCFYFHWSFVIIVSISRKDIHIDLNLEDAVYKSMLLCDFSTPSSFGFPFQWFGMSQSCFRMLS